MIDPYRMIVVNIIASTLVGLGIVIYKKRYPEKKINLFYLLLLIMVLPLISILRKGSYQSGDLSLHVKYGIQFFENIKEGNLIPQWIGNHCHTYGCPEYIFIFFLPYYIISIFHFVGIPFIASVKILLIVSFFLSGIGMYKWIKDELGDLSGFVAAIFYLFAPYHLIDLHFRVSIGEIVAYAILPFIFLCIKRLTETKKLFYFLGVSLLLSLLILAHNATAFVSSPFIFLYSLVVFMRMKKKKISNIFVVIASLGLGVLLSAFYWLPILKESKYILYVTSSNLDFHKFSEFFYSPHRYGLLFQGHMGQLYFNVGYAQWLIIILAIYVLFKKRVLKNDRNLLLFLLFSFLLLFFMMQSVSQPIWNVFSFAKNIQFSWRLLIEISLFISVIAGIVVKYIKSQAFVILLCSFAILYTILNWGNRQAEPNITDQTLETQSVFTDTSSYELTTPIWINLKSLQATTIPKSHIEVLSGQANIIQIKRSQTIHVYNIDVKKDAVIKENTYYFPGWKLFVNGKEQKIDYQNRKYEGVITFTLKKGQNDVKLIFTYSPISILGQKISALSAGIFVILALIALRNKQKAI